jgi:GxxExxY protein
MTENEISYLVIGAAIELHKSLGPGLLESVYEVALARDLQQLGLKVDRQKGMSFVYKDFVFDRGFRIDLLVENKLIIELKSVEYLMPVHFSQTLTYLKLSNRKLGLLINFNSAVLRNGVHRVVNGL